MTRLVSILTPTFNEEENVRLVHARVRDAMSGIEGVDYEHVFIDNASTDSTQALLREIAAEDPRVKLIFNTRNFGHIRSPYHGILQCDGDCVVPFVADLQDPPEVLPEMVQRWVDGAKVVLCVKNRSEERWLMRVTRRLYYRLVGGMASARLVSDNTGFGLYDRAVVELLRQMDDVYPYFRGMTAELGFEPEIIQYDQPARARGITKNNFYTLYDMAWLGITSHSKVPLRAAAMIGFGGAILSLVIALVYLVLKLANWSNFELGFAPLVIGLFLSSSVQLVFLGVIGEYVGAIHTQVLHRPLVVEKERVNWGHGPR